MRGSEVDPHSGWGASPHPNDIYSRPVRGQISGGRPKLSRSHLKIVAGSLALIGVGVWAATAGGPPAPCKIKFDAAGGVVCPGSTPGPINVDIRLDQTMLRGDAQIAQGAKSRVAAAADLAIDNGGTLTISVFGRSAARSRSLLDQQVPTLEDLRLSQRGGVQDELRAKVANALASWTASPNDADGDGTDIPGGLGLPSSTALTPRAPDLRVVITDGRVDLPASGYRLVTELRKNSPVAAAASLARLLPSSADSSKPGGLEIFGIGGTGGLIRDENPALTEALTETYHQLCPKLAPACYATSTL